MVCFKKDRAPCFGRHLAFESLEHLPYLDLCKVQTLGHFCIEMILIDDVSNIILKTIFVRLVGETTL